MCLSAVIDHDHDQDGDDDDKDDHDHDGDDDDQDGDDDDKDNHDHNGDDQDGDGDGQDGDDDDQDGDDDDKDDYKVEDGWKASKMMSRAQSSVTANYTVMCQSGPRRKYQGKLTLIKVQDEIVSDSRTELS